MIITVVIALLQHVLFRPFGITGWFIVIYMVHILALNALMHDFRLAGVSQQRSSLKLVHGLAPNPGHWRKTSSSFGHILALVLYVKPKMESTTTKISLSVHSDSWTGFDILLFLLEHWKTSTINVNEFHSHLFLWLVGFIAFADITDSKMTGGHYWTHLLPAVGCLHRWASLLLWSKFRPSRPH